MALTDAEYAKHRDRTMRLFVRWIPALELNRHRLVFAWHRDEPEPIEGSSGSTTKLMQIRSQWEYRAATIDVYLGPIARNASDDDDLEWHVIHELLHLHINPIRNEDAHDLEEFVVSSIATAIQNLRDRIVNDPEAWRRSRPEVNAATIILLDEDDPQIGVLADGKRAGTPPAPPEPDEPTRKTSRR